MYRYIIVDDEPVIRQGVRLKIKKTGLPLEFCGEAGNGEEALAIIGSVDPEIVVMDMKMPIMDGRALLGELKKLYADKKIVVMSGYSDYEYMRDAINAQAVDYILKPLSSEEIGKALLHVIEALDRDRASTRIVPWADLSKLVQCVKSGNALEALDLLGGFFDMLAQTPSMDGARFNENCGSLLQMAADAVSHEPHGQCEAGIIMLADAGIDETREFVSRKLIEICRIATRARSNTSEAIIDSVRGYVFDNYSRTISLERISIAFSISPNYFCNLFKKVTGQNFIDFVNSVRVGKAKEMLLNTDMKVYEIAGALGFSNPKYFLRVFKKFTDRTPGEIRNSGRPGS